jgi:hypothetical protein
MYSISVPVVSKCEIDNVFVQLTDLLGFVMTARSQSVCPWRHASEFQKVASVAGPM